MTYFRLVSMLATGAAVFAVLTLDSRVAIADSDDWDKDWTALTISDTGDWGTATSSSRIDAMIGAMAQCRQNAGRPVSGCGSHITTVRGGWSLGYACESETYIATGSTYADAVRAAINREIDLRELEKIEIGHCRRVIAIGPDGQPAAAALLDEVLPLIPERAGTATSEKFP